QIDVTIIPSDTCIWCDPQLLSLALVQIVDNADKYAPEYTPVMISAESHGPEFVLRIHNQGSYIPPTERNKVFTRFYRCPSVEHSAPGTGLGLLVAKKAIDAHGGRISIESDVQTGTSFVISIPAKVEELI